MSDDDATSAPRRAFLTARWEHLAMINHAIDPEVLAPLVPRGTELDFFEGRTFVSVVGFRFLDTRVLGVPIPLHRDFEEVNLRFYVRRRSGSEWRRGVVFVRELVPKAMIAAVARGVFGEPYRALPMRHGIRAEAGRLRVSYEWRRAGRWEGLSAAGEGEPREAPAGSEEEFITEHYWGYTARGERCSEYRVEHPRWRVWRATETSFDADVATLYGPRFVEALAAPPTSAFIADGSPVTVRMSRDAESAPP